MKINTTLTAAENILAALNEANPSLNASLNQLTFAAPVAQAGTGGRNAVITVTGVDGKGFEGSNTYNFTRLALQSGQAIPTSRANPVTIASGDTDAQILTKAAVALGLLESELTIGSVVAPTDSANPGSAIITAKASSVLYIDSYSLVTEFPDTDVPLTTAAPNQDLNGFDPEG